MTYGSFGPHFEAQNWGKIGLRPWMRLRRGEQAGYAPTSLTGAVFRALKGREIARFRAGRKSGKSQIFPKTFGFRASWSMVKFFTFGVENRRFSDFASQNHLH